jgi:hypothetical protein
MIFINTIFLNGFKITKIALIYFSYNLNIIDFNDPSCDKLLSIRKFKYSLIIWISFKKYLIQIHCIQSVHYFFDYHKLQSMNNNFFIGRNIVY